MDDGSDETELEIGTFLNKRPNFFKGSMQKSTPCLKKPLRSLKSRDEVKFDMDRINHDKHDRRFSVPFCLCFGSLSRLNDASCFNRSKELSEISRVYTPVNHFSNCQSKNSTIHWYPSTRRTLLSSSVQNPILQTPDNNKTGTTCTACGGSGKVFFVNEGIPESLVSNCSLNMRPSLMDTNVLWKKTFSSTE